MEYKVGDKVRMNRKTRYFRDIENSVSLAWWLVLEKNEPITILDIEEDNGMNILTTDHNDLKVSDLWVLPYERGD